MNLWKRLFGDRRKGKSGAFASGGQSDPEQRKGTAEAVAPAPIPEPKPLTRAQRILKTLHQQSYARHLVLDCMRPLYKAVPEELDDSSEEALEASMIRYLESLYEQADPPTNNGARFHLACIASGLLMYGRLDMVEVVLDNTTREQFMTDHYCGQCNLLPYFAISTALPIPRTICNCGLAGGRINIRAAKEWFHANREQLQWSGEKRCFVFLET